METRLHATGFAAPTRQRFLDDCLADLDRRSRRLGAALVIRRGNVITEISRLAAEVDASEVQMATDPPRSRCDGRTG